MERTPDKFARLVTYVVIAIALGAMCLGVMSCNPSNRATKHVYKAVRIDRPAAGMACGEIFPPTDSTHVIKEYIQGEKIIVRDTFTDYQIKVVNDTAYITRTRYVETHSTDTIRLDKYEREQNRGIVEGLNKQLKDTAIKIAKLEQSISNWRNVALSCIALIAIFVAWQLIKLWRKATVRI